MAESFHTLIVPFRPFQIRLAVEHRKSVLSKRHMKRSLRNSCSIAHLAYKQIVTHKQRLLQRRRRNDIVLEEIQIDEIYCNQSEYDGIHPAHHGYDKRIGRFLPPCPRYFLGYINIEDKRYGNYTKPALQPDDECQIKNHCYGELYPLFA